MYIIYSALNAPVWVDLYLTGAGEASCPPGARHGHCEDGEVGGGEGSRHGEGTEAPQGGKRLSEVRKSKPKGQGEAAERALPECSSV